MAEINKDVDEALLEIPCICLDIQMGNGGDRDSWIAGNVPLELGYPENIKFRATEADKEIIAKSVISLLKKWARIDD